jgi:hypothetical protein
MHNTAATHEEYSIWVHNLIEKLGCITFAPAYQDGILSLSCNAIRKFMWDVHMSEEAFDAFVIANNSEVIREKTCTEKFTEVSTFAANEQTGAPIRFFKLVAHNN